MTVSVPTPSFDFEVTLCPICDEACTCPKTTTILKSPPSKHLKKIIETKKPSPSVPKSKPAPVMKSKLNSDRRKNRIDVQKVTRAEYYSDYSISEADEPAEDPALSFIRMIYSDEESLDEEEAYALYQATQLFSSSDEEYVSPNEDEDFDDYENDESDSEDDSQESDGFEYTVVEYVQPLRKKKLSSTNNTNTEYVAYESNSEAEDSDSDESSLLPGLILNANESDDLGEEEEDSHGSVSSYSTTSDGDEEEESAWLTYSVFDVDRDLALNTNQKGNVLSLSSQGSVAPDTLLFSTSSTDKIPNIAPQVLAAISAAAKHMAQQNGSGSSSKYFSYITLKDPSFRGEEVNEDEFLFFEEAEAETETETEGDVELSMEMEIEGSESETEYDCISDISSDSDPEILEIDELDPPPPRKMVKRTTLTSVSSLNQNSNAEQQTALLNRWNRVPIGAFRRSRRPSIPNYHHIHPSNALKTFSDPTAALTLTAATLHNHNNGEDSFDEATTTTTINSVSCTPEQERAYSVVTWDELDMDITNNSGVPKRSRSVAPFSNNYEWLNSNWNWEI